MLISMLTTRKADTRAMTRLSWWTPTTGLREILTVTWSPEGPMDLISATRRALHEALAALSRLDAGEDAQPAERSWEDVPLPGLDA